MMHELQDIQNEVHGMLSDSTLHTTSKTAAALNRASQPEQIVRKAEERFVAAGDGPICVADLCAAAGVRKSSLYAAFHRIYGCRLNRARLILLNAAPERGKIKCAALQVGLTEPGRFSVDYRKLFGESPSATLARSAAERMCG